VQIAILEDCINCIADEHYAGFDLTRKRTRTDPAQSPGLGLGILAVLVPSWLAGSLLMEHGEPNYSV
jgi:hypothetical protein